MINRAEIVRQGDIEARFPTFTDEQVKGILHSKIEVVRRNVEAPIRIGHSVNHDRPLFDFRGEEFSSLEDENGTIGKVEFDRLQRLGFEVMGEYGFDKNTTKTYKGGSRKNGIDYPGGNSQEYITYPSTTINDLAFERTRVYIRATGKAVYVGWSVVNNGPFLKVNLGRKSRKSA